MAAPHVAGAVALIWSSAYKYRGDLPATLHLLQSTAVDLDDTHCGGTPTANNVFGEGRLDVFAAVRKAHYPFTYWLPLLYQEFLDNEP